MLTFIVKAAYFAGVVTSVASLEHYSKFRESSCTEIGKVHRPLTNLNMEWLGSLTHYPIGSKYIMYLQAYPHPRYDKLREDEYYYDFCLRRNTSVEGGLGVFTGFGGRTLGIFDVRRRPDRPEIAYEAFPRNLDTQDFARIYITLTDNKTFAFVEECWIGSNQRSWNVISNTPNLSERAVKMIENHAIELGFKKENFVFIRYDGCRREDPVIRSELARPVSTLRRNIAAPSRISTRGHYKFS